MPRGTFTAESATIELYASKAGVNQITIASAIGTANKNTTSTILRINPTLVYILL